jgi:hypothetical protein
MEAAMKLSVVQVAGIAVIAVVAISPAHAGHAAREAAKQVIALADGGTLYVFHDGLMAKENRYGRATSLEVGAVVEAKDGRKITMTSNEVARLSQLLDLDHHG